MQAPSGLVRGGYVLFMVRGGPATVFFTVQYMTHAPEHSVPLVGGKEYGTMAHGTYMTVHLM